MKYKIIRFYHDDQSLKCEVLRGLTLEQAKKRCSDPETSSATATSEWAMQHTKLFGDWFEGWTEE